MVREEVDPDEDTFAYTERLGIACADCIFSPWSLVLLLATLLAYFTLGNLGPGNADIAVIDIANTGGVGNVGGVSNQQLYSCSAAEGSCVENDRGTYSSLGACEAECFTVEAEPGDSYEVDENGAVASEAGNDWSMGLVPGRAPSPSPPAPSPTPNQVSDECRGSRDECEERWAKRDREHREWCAWYLRWGTFFGMLAATIFFFCLLPDSIVERKVTCGIVLFFLLHFGVWVIAYLTHDWEWQPIQLIVNLLSRIGTAWLAETYKTQILPLDVALTLLLLNNYQVEKDAGGYIMKASTKMNMTVSIYGYELFKYSEAMDRTIRLLPVTWIVYFVVAAVLACLLVYGHRLCCCGGKGKALESAFGVGCEGVADFADYTSKKLRPKKGRDQTSKTTKSRWSRRVGNG